LAEASGLAHSAWAWHCRFTVTLGANPTAARSALERALAWAEARGDSYARVITLASLAYVQAEAGEHALAVELADEALCHARTASYPEALGTVP